jgi:tetratricopeptide (TPR) repeat protein
MHLILARVLPALTHLALVLASATALPAKAEQAYCTPEVYLPAGIDASIKVCNAMIADKRYPLRSHAQAYENLGDLYMRKGQFDLAIPNYDQAVALITKATKFTDVFERETPTSVGRIEAAGVYYQRGLAFRSRSDHQHAIDDFTKSLQIREDSQALWHRGEAYAGLNQFDAAIRDLDRAIALSPDSSLYIDARAKVHLKKNDYDKAIADYDRVIALAPKDGDAFNERGLAYLGKNDLARALENFDKAVELSSTAAVHDNRGQVRHKQGNLEGALADFNDAITQGRIANKDDMSSYYVHRAEIFAEKGEWLKALEDNQSALTGNQYNSKALAGRDAARLALSGAAARQQAASAAPAAAPSAVPKQAAAPAVLDKRIALVIGNSAYKNAPALPNPVRDATAVADALRRIGFKTVALATDAGKEKLVDALRNFAQAADDADWALVYYAGHGIEMGGMNYLIPIDARLATDRDVGFEAVPLDQVLSAVEGAKKLRLVLLDACRDNPFASQMRRTLASASRSIGRGLASIEPEAGTLVVYAAKHGETALDGDASNSPFALAFMKNIQTPGLEVRRLFDFVRDDVMDMTQRRQQPFSYGSVSGRQEFYFVSAQ